VLNPEQTGFCNMVANQTAGGKLEKGRLLETETTNGCSLIRNFLLMLAIYSYTNHQVLYLRFIYLEIISEFT